MSNVYSDLQPSKRGTQAVVLSQEKKSLLPSVVNGVELD